MIELECPWCQEPGRVDFVAFVAEDCMVRCDGCGVEVEIGEQRSLPAMARAA